MPKYQDYVGTPMEEAAQHELEESQKLYAFLIRAIKEYVDDNNLFATEEEIKELIIYLWCTLHGYIAGINNTL